MLKAGCEPAGRAGTNRTRLGRRIAGIASAVRAALAITGCDFSSRASSKPGFEDWLAQDPKRSLQFAAFEAHLSQANVDQIVPSWQLVRMDANYAARCGAEYFAIPPADLWDNIIPTLEMVRDHVVPVIGAVEVVSAWRPEQINTCIGGAARSQHLRFAAVDMVSLENRPVRAMFADLCVMHRAAGGRSAIGLGVYFDPDFPWRNAIGRFHIDSAGYRRWGYDYTRKSDPCPSLTNM